MRPIARLSATDRLLALDVCLVSDALDQLGMRGAVAGLVPVWEGARMAGVVTTMTLVPADGRVSQRHLGVAAIESSPRRGIIVIHQESEAIPESASWGGLLARAAVLAGMGGVITDGACRDVDEIRTVRLPVSARAVVPFTARRRFVEDSVGEPVTIAGVTVASGDLVIADGSGVALIPLASADEVLGAAERLAARERLMVADLERGARPSEVLARNYETMLDADPVA